MPNTRINLIVFGAQGRTGQEVVKQALKKQYQVTAFIYKNNNTLPSSKKLKICEGNARNYDDVYSALNGADIVINIIAPKLGDSKNYNISVVATKNIIKAMQATGIKRYFGQCGSWATERIDDASLPLKIGFKLFLPLKNIYKYKIQEDSIIKSSGLDWTIVRCALLTNKELKWPIKEYINGYKCKTFEIPKISRKSVAKYYIKNLDNNNLIHKCPDILN